jgi:site-specific DNA recombinase
MVPLLVSTRSRQWRYCSTSLRQYSWRPIFMKNETTSNDSKRAVIYCRVSTKEQADEGNSLVSQERLCREYAIREGYTIVESFIERGESAKTADRKQLQAMLSFCENRKNSINDIVTYKVDRISRNTGDYLYIKVRLKKVNVGIKSITEHFDDNPAGRFMENIIANVSQFDNEVRTERSVGGMKEAVQEGRYVWKAPLGYDNVRIDNKATIAPNPTAPLVREAFELVAKRYYSTEIIRQMMKEKGLVGRKGDAVNKAYFFRLLRNPVYKGVLTQFGSTIKSSYEPLISEALFDDVQSALKRRKNKAKFYNKEHPDFPLRRFVINEDGKQLTGYWSKGKYKKYPYYSFHLPGTTIRKEELETKFKELLQQFAFDLSHINLLKTFLISRHNKEITDSRLATNAVKQRIEELNKDIEFLFVAHRKGSVSESLFSRRLSTLEAELDELTDLMRSRAGEDIDLDGLMQCTAKVLTEPHTFWENSPLNTKRKLQEFYFPEGIVFDGENCRTPRICFIFKLKETLDSSKFSIVDLRSSGKNTLQTHPFTSLPENMMQTKEFFGVIAEELALLKDISQI